MKSRLEALNTALKMFILSVCLLNFTACSAVSKKSETKIESESRQTTKTDSSKETISTKSEIRNSESSVEKESHQDQKTRQDSILKNVVRNNKSVDKLETRIDSIISNDHKIYGIRTFERSSSVSNEEDKGKIFGVEHTSSQSGSEENHSEDFINKDFTHSDNTKVKHSKDSDSKSSADTVDASTTKGALLFIFCAVTSSWWFWILLIVITTGVWFYRKGVNPLSWFKIIYQKLLGNRNNDAS